MATVLNCTALMSESLQFALTLAYLSLIPKPLWLRVKMDCWMGMSLTHCWRKPQAESELKVHGWLWVLPFFIVTVGTTMRDALRFSFQGQGEGSLDFGSGPRDLIRDFLEPWMGKQRSVYGPGHLALLWGGVQILCCYIRCLWASSREKFLVLIHLPFWL